MIPHLYTFKTNFLLLCAWNIFLHVFPCVSVDVQLDEDEQERMGVDLLCWGSGQLGQTGHGGPGGMDVSPEEAHLRDFTPARLGAVKLLACGSTHSIVVTGTYFTGNRLSCLWSHRWHV